MRAPDIQRAYQPRHQSAWQDITNNTGGTIRSAAFLPTGPSTDGSEDRPVAPNGAEVWNKSDPDSPTNIPAEGNWTKQRYPLYHKRGRGSLLIQFSNDLQPTGYEVHVIFEHGCQVIGTR